MHRLFVGFAFPAVLFGLACGGWSSPGGTPVEPAPYTTPIDGDAAAFYSSQYTYCDALVLARYWKTDSWDAKLRISSKLGSGSAAWVVTELATAQSDAHAHNETPCSYFDSELGYDDADALAGLWGVDIDTAKTRIGQKLSWGDRTSLMEQLARAPRGGGYEGGEGGMVDDGDMAAFSAFESSPYTYCDAALLGHTWNSSAWDGKITIGYKLTNGWGELIPPLLAGARAQGRADGFACHYWDEGYSYDDAEVLAKLWGVSVDQAKSKIEDRLYSGNDPATRADLARARG